MQTSRSGSTVKAVMLPTSGWSGASEREKACSTLATHTRLSNIARSLPGQRRIPWPKGMTTFGGGSLTEPSASTHRRAMNLPGSGPGWHGLNLGRQLAYS